MLQPVLKTIDAISEWTGRAVSWLAALLVAVIVFDVTRRYVFDRGSIELQELEFHLYATIFLVGAAYTLLHQGHVRIDVFYARLSRRGRALVDVMGAALFFFPYWTIILWLGVGFFLRSWGLREASSAPGGLPALYVLKGVLPAAMVLLLLQGAAQFVRDLTLLFRGKPLEQ